MLKKRSVSIKKAFEKACKENDIIFKKADKDSEGNEITLLDSKGSYFKLDKNLKIIDIPDRNSVSLQSLEGKKSEIAGSTGVSSDLYINEPLYLKTADDIDVALVALGPGVNEAVHIHDKEGTAFHIPYFTMKNKTKKLNTVKNNINGRRIQNKKKGS